MSPFGFTPDDGKDDSEKPDDFSAMMRQMQEQIQKQFEQMGINPAAMVNPFAAFAQGSKDPLPKSVVRDTAKKFIQAHGSQPVGTKDVTVVENAFEIADLWLNEATVFPATASSTSPRAISRLDWSDLTLDGWNQTMEPLAVGLAGAISGLLDEATAGSDESNASMGAITGLLRTFIGSMIATQLGQSIGSISASASGAHDVGLPLLDPATPVLIPENIENWSNELEIPKSEVYIFHALREAAVARLFAHNPWIVSYIRSAIVDYGRGIHIDMDAITRQAEEAMQNFDPSQTNPDSGENSFTIALNSGVFTPEETPAQRAALSKLETALALVDGWTDDVATLAAGERLPSLPQLREVNRRQRATNAPSQQLFKSLLGLEVRPRLAREAHAFWQKVRELKDVSARDQIWSGILPSAEELLDPEKFLDSAVIPDDLSGLN
ncbi:MAG: zinc-dependent metalloprotease [Actinobacteria bacterium]|jgi:putative hydrolase|nr:zinc-dependent metalloprotease [Actinomycetota bacterium]